MRNKPGVASKMVKDPKVVLPGCVRQKNLYPILASIIVFAVVKTILLSALYPMFSPIDEPEHYDVISKYARGHMPQKGELFDDKAYLLTVIKSTREYILSEEDLRRDKRSYFGTIDDMPAGMRDEILSKKRLRSGEAGQMPLYYFLSAIAKQVAESAGLQDENIVYFLRFLNVAILALLIVAAFYFVRAIYPEDPLLAIGVPLMISLIPQDAFFQIGNDALSPLIFLIACIFLFKVMFDEEAGKGTFVLAGSFAALAVLTKLSNIPIYAVAALAILARMKYFSDAKLRKREMVGLILLVSAAAIPPVLWGARNYFVFGDISGFGERAAMLGWTKKPIAEWFLHPIFTGNGLYIFVKDLSVKFWRGEFIWHGRPVFSSSTDSFFIFSTAIFLSAAFVNMMNADKRKEKKADALFFLVMAMFALQLIYVTTAFDFGNCYYPSRQYPYNTSGRIILGGLVPFLILYLRGYQFIVRRSGIAAAINPLLILAVIMVLVNIADIRLNWHIFTSDRNWFYYNFTRR